MLRTRSAVRSGTPRWIIFAFLAVGLSLLTVLTTPVSADEVTEAPAADVTSDDGEALTTPATPFRRFVWRIRNWMFHRDDVDNVEVDAAETTEPSVEKSASGESDGVMDKPRSWARSIAVWFARGIRHLLEQLYPPEDGVGPDGKPLQNGTFAEPDGGSPSDGPRDAGEDSPINPNHHIFRPWTALPPPPPPGATASTGSGTSSSERSPATDDVTTPEVPSSAASSTADTRPPSTNGFSTPKMKKARRRRPTTTTFTPPPAPPLSTEETFVQDTGNEI